MAEEGSGQYVQVEHQSNAGKWILIVVAILAVAGFGYAQYMSHLQIQALSQGLSASQAQVKELQNRMQTAEAQEETLARDAGMTKKQLAQRAAALQAEQRAAESRIEQEQKAQISAVSGEITGVKTDVGGVRTDVASTKADLEATKAKLQGTIGDLGMQSGLIAHTQSDLEVLKHKGDRNYYEFTLLKGAKPQPVVDREPAAQEGRCKERQVHDECHRGRQDDRKEGPQRRRAHSVLFGTRSPAVRVGGVDCGQEQGHGIFEHAEKCSRAGDGELTLHHERSVLSRRPRACCRSYVRTGVIYLLVLIGVRLSGKREVGQMTPFDLTLLLLLSNSVQNAMTGPDTSLLGGAVAAATLLILNYLVADVSGGSRRLRRLIQGQPSLLVHDGQIIESHMAREHVSMDELHRALREHGISSCDQVALAVLEVDGSISCLKYDEIKQDASTHLVRRRFIQKKS